MEIGIYITDNIIYVGRELCMGDRVVCSSLLGKRVVTTPFAERHFSSVLWPLSRRCAANNLFIYSSRPRHSRLVAASWSWKCNSVRNEKCMRNALKI